MRLLRGVGALLPMSVALLGPVAALGLTITVTFDGTVTEVDAPLASVFAEGGIAFGSFQIDADTSDTNPDANRGLYPGLKNISFSVDGYAASAVGGDPISAVQIANEVVDFYDVYTGGPFAGAMDVGVFRLTAFQFQLFAEGNTAFDSDALPTSLDISQFADGRVVLNFYDGQTNAIAVAAISSFTMTVPEPTRGVLWVVGAATLLFSATKARGSRRCPGSRSRSAHRASRRS
jgi:hypothetical protein